MTLERTPGKFRGLTVKQQGLDIGVFKSCLNKIYISGERKSNKHFHFHSSRFYFVAKDLEMA